jgi:hypothetical protein
VKSGFTPAGLFVLTVLFAGIVIHIFGSFGIQTGDAGFLAHYAMLAADSVAFVGLLLRQRWGYWFATGLFIYAAFSQSFWTIEAVIKGYDMAAAQGITAFLCFVSLFLLVRRNLFE